MIDAYYTPEHLADSMIRLAEGCLPNTIADFAAGDGALLNAATKRWPGARIIASDLCDSTIRRLRNHKSDWSVSKVDFLKANSRGRSPLLQKALGAVDLILLNPPFSCRGGTKFESSVYGTKCSASLALSFVIQAFEYLAENGKLIAILPASTFESEKDRKALALINEHFVVKHGVYSKRGEFENCNAKCVVVRFSRRKNRRAPRTRVARMKPSIKVKIVRGTVPLHQKTGCERTLVHSTDLIEHKVILNGHVAGAKRPSVVGPCVLVHRVGLPKLEKIAIFKKRKRVVLSDCVIGIQCSKHEDAVWLHNRMKESCTQLFKLYKGTCAPYITIKKLTEFLSSIGCAIVE